MANVGHGCSPIFQQSWNIYQLSRFTVASSQMPAIEQQHGKSCRRQPLCSYVKARVTRSTEAVRHDHDSTGLRHGWTIQPSRAALFPRREKNVFTNPCAVLRLRRLRCRRLHLLTHSGVLLQPRSVRRCTACAVQSKPATCGRYDVNRSWSTVAGTLPPVQDGKATYFWRPVVRFVNLSRFNHSGSRLARTPSV